MVGTEVHGVEREQLAQADIHAIDVCEREMTLCGSRLVRDDDAFIPERSKPSKCLRCTFRGMKLVGVERGEEDA